MVSMLSKVWMENLISTTLNTHSSLSLAYLPFNYLSINKKQAKDQGHKVYKKSHADISSQMKRTPFDDVLLSSFIDIYKEG